MDIIKIGDVVEVENMFYENGIVKEIYFLYNFPYSRDETKSISIPSISYEMKDKCVFTFENYDKWAWGYQVNEPATIKTNESKLRNVVANIVENMLKTNNNNIK